MTDTLPARKYIKVWVEKRKNPPKMDGSHSISYTLEWVEFGKRRFMSLGKGATATYAARAAKLKERELNSMKEQQGLEPLTWDQFRQKYLDTHYPGHGLPTKERKAAAKAWGKSEASLAEERRVLEMFAKTIKPGWCHDITTEDREKYIQGRILEVESPISVEKDLRILRFLFNILEDWHHRPKDSNPFAGRGNATIGTKRKREKEQKRVKLPKYYTRSQVVALLDQSDCEAIDWEGKRLRALLYFEAFTGVRIKEALYLEWQEIDFDTGVAHVNHKVEHGLKTEDSQAPVGLPDALLAVLRKWWADRTCNWVFPNARKKPWTGGSKETKHLEQLKGLAKRAGIEHATWKMFRHTLTTHGKQWFGMSSEQMRIQLRHTTEETQKHYEHADLENLHASVKAIDFRRGGDRDAEVPPRLS
jgi:integrase